MALGPNPTLHRFCDHGHAIEAAFLFPQQDCGLRENNRDVWPVELETFTICLFTGQPNPNLEEHIWI